MATNYIQPGDNLSILAPTNVTSGAPVFAGQIVGIALGDAASGASLDVATCGVFDLAKVGADAVTLGAVIYWDTSAALATIDDDTGANAKLGVAVASAAASTGTVRVRLSGF